jgi:hypothetical protein
MTFAIYNQQAERTESHQDPHSECAMWSAVLMLAVEDLRCGNQRRRKEAATFFFDSPEDLATVCGGAGLDPGSVLGKMRKIEQVVLDRRKVSFQLAA